MKKVVQELTGLANPNDKLLVGLCSVSKMFVGELVSTGMCLPCECLCFVSSRCEGR